MISVAEADHIIQDNAPPLDSETVPLSAAAGRYLQEDVAADRDLPPYERAMMDGIAICHRAWAAGRRDFRIAARIPAGSPAEPLPDESCCVEIMTGAVTPEGADCVIPVEELTVADGVAIINDQAAPTPGMFVHRRGSDRHGGDIVLRRGTLLQAPQIAVLASVGKATAEVDRPPATAIVSTGDELVEVSEQPAPHQIRQCNADAMAGILRRYGVAHITTHRLPDERQAMTAALKPILAAHELVILSGGISKGKFDFVPEVLAQLGVDWRIRRVSQRPGKPFCFGPHRDGAQVFALPGNPVSTIVCCHRYIVPQLIRRAGGKLQREYAELGADFHFEEPRTCFLPVAVTSAPDGKVIATPAPLNNSGDFSSLTDSDGFVELEADRTDFPAGWQAPLFRWQR